MSSKVVLEKRRPDTVMAEWRVLLQRSGKMRVGRRQSPWRERERETGGSAPAPRSHRTPQKCASGSILSGPTAFCTVQRCTHAASVRRRPPCRSIDQSGRVSRRLELQSADLQLHPLKPDHDDDARVTKRSCRCARIPTRSGQQRALARRSPAPIPYLPVAMGARPASRFSRLCRIRSVRSSLKSMGPPKPGPLSIMYVPTRKRRRRSRARTSQTNHRKSISSKTRHMEMGIERWGV
jgi:hypothetical protein